MRTKKIYLYNPISNTKTPTTYDELEHITGLSKNTLMSTKAKKSKIACLNRYIIDDSTTLEGLYHFMIKQKLKSEIWKDVQGSKSRYQVSNYGRIRRVYKSNKTKLLMPYIRKNKYLHVKVTINDKLTEYKVHRLVAEHFIENEKGYPYVYHKNEDIYDNYADNLAWIDAKTLGEKTAHKASSIPVLKIDPLTGEVLEEYTSMAEAGRFNYLHRETIRMCVKGELKTAGGYKWAIDKEFVKASSKSRSVS